MVIEVEGEVDFAWIKQENLIENATFLGTHNSIRASDIDRNVADPVFERLFVISVIVEVLGIGIDDFHVSRDQVVKRCVRLSNDGIGINSEHPISLP